MSNNKMFAVMLFNTEFELGISNNPNKWVNVKNYKFYGNDAGIKALNFYANIPNPASQLIEAYSEQELIDKMNSMLKNFNDNQWLNNNLYPYL